MNPTFGDPWNHAYKEEAKHFNKAINKFERDAKPIVKDNHFWPVETWEERQERIKEKTNKQMNHYRITMTINVFVDAESEDAAQEIAENLDISFMHEGKALEQNLIDWEVKETND